MEFPAKVFQLIPACESYITRMAVSHTPAADITLRQFAFVGQRGRWVAKHDETVGDLTTIDWEIRADDGAGKPNTTAPSLLASGSFDFRYTSVWKIFRIMKFAVTLGTALALTSGTKYWFVLKSPSDVRYVNNPLYWATTYETGAGSEVDAAVFCSVYDDNANTWGAADNTYNQTLYIASAQAGVQWHVVIDDIGYMTPDKLRGYQCTQGASPLAQSRGGQSEYSQLRFPYTSLSQDSWIGGSGQLNMTDGDMTAFLYSLNLDTLVPGQAILGPKRYKTGTDATTVVASYETADSRIFVLPGTGAYTAGALWFAQKWKATANFTVTEISIKTNILLDGFIAAHVLDVALFDSDGEPDANLTGWQRYTVNYGSYYWGSVTVNQAVTLNQDYWIVAKVTVPGWSFFGPHIALAFDKVGGATDGLAKHSPDGTTWTDFNHAGETNSMFFRLNGGFSVLPATPTKFAYGEANGVAYLVCLAGRYVYYWHEGNQHWIDMSTGIMGNGVDLLTVTGTDLIFFNDQLFVAQGYGNNARVWDGVGYVFGSWSDVGQAVTYWHISHGYLWASTNVSEIKHSNDGAAWSAAIVVGTNLYDITGFIDYSGRFLIGKENGIWDWEASSDLTIEYTRFEGQAHADNCKGWEVWSGMMFIPIQNTAVWRWQPSGYKEVGPTQAQLAGPSSKWANQLTRFASTASRLWASAKAMAATGYGGLQVYNGLGWHNYLRHENVNEDNIAVFVTTEVGSEYRVWYGEGSRISYIKLPTFTNNRFDWASADYVDSGVLVTSWWDGGLKDALKFWNRLTVIADLPTDTFINVYLAKDGEDWETTADMVLLGQLTNDQLTADNEYVLMFGDYMVAKSIQLVFELGTTNTAWTPRIRAYNMECLIRQIPVNIHQFRIALAKNFTKLDKTTMTRTPAQQWEELQRARAKNNPILVSFPGFTVRGFISHLSRITMQYAAEGTRGVKWEHVANVAVIEAT